MEKKVIQGFRLSPPQEHLWSSQQDEAGGDYRVACLVSIEGELDPRILKMALQHVVERHEILRTTLHCSPEMTLPIQVINENDGFSMQEFDLSDLEPPKQEIEIGRLIDEVNQETFDPQQTPILHASLITRSPFESMLQLGLPALCGDAETLINLVREVGLAYDDCTTDPHVHCTIETGKNPKDTAPPFCAAKQATAIRSSFHSDQSGNASRQYFGPTNDREIGQLFGALVASWKGALIGK